MQNIIQISEEFTQIHLVEVKTEIDFLLSTTEIDDNSPLKYFNYLMAAQIQQMTENLVTENETLMSENDTYSIYISDLATEMFTGLITYFSKIQKNASVNFTIDDITECCFNDRDICDEDIQEAVEYLTITYTDFFSATRIKERTYRIKQIKTNITELV